MALNSVNKAYVEGQRAWIAKHNVEKGTVVKVIRVADNGELGWYNDWIDEMDSAVGGTYTVDRMPITGEDDIFEAGGIRLETIGSTSSFYDLMFPYYVLEVL